MRKDDQQATSGAGEQQHALYTKSCPHVESTVDLVPDELMGWSSRGKRRRSFLLWTRADSLEFQSPSSLQTRNERNSSRSIHHHSLSKSHHFHEFKQIRQALCGQATRQREGERERESSPLICSLPKRHENQGSLHLLSLILHTSLFSYTIQPDQTNSYNDGAIVAFAASLASSTSRKQYM